MRSYTTNLLNIMERKNFILKMVHIAVFVLFCTNFAIISAAEPVFVFRYIPPLGETGNAQGKVVLEGLNSENAANYAVIAMLHAIWEGGGGYYVKPYANRYLNPVDANGRFSILITTGGIDPVVNEVIFYLVEREKIGDADVVSPAAMAGKYLATATILRDQWVNPPLEIIAMNGRELFSREWKSPYPLMKKVRYSSP